MAFMGRMPAFVILLLIQKGAETIEIPRTMRSTYLGHASVSATESLMRPSMASVSFRVKEGRVTLRPYMPATSLAMPRMDWQSPLFGGTLTSST